MSKLNPTKSDFWLLFVLMPSLLCMFYLIVCKDLGISPFSENGIPFWFRFVFLGLVLGFVGTTCGDK